MNRQVAIVGVGWSGYRSITPDLSYKELMFEAATKAYADAEIDPRNDVDGFVTIGDVQSPMWSLSRPIRLWCRRVRRKRWGRRCQLAFAPVLP